MTKVDYLVLSFTQNLILTWESFGGLIDSKTTYHDALIGISLFLNGSHGFSQFSELQ